MFVAMKEIMSLTGLVLASLDHASLLIALVTTRMLGLSSQTTCTSNSLPPLFDLSRLGNFDIVILIDIWSHASSLLWELEWK